MSIGEEHPVAVNAPPSSEHSNGVVGCSPLSAPENVNLIELNDVLLPAVMAVPPAPTWYCCTVYRSSGLSGINCPCE